MVKYPEEFPAALSMFIKIMDKDAKVVLHARVMLEFHLAQYLNDILQDREAWSTLYANRHCLKAVMTMQLTECDLSGRLRATFGEVEAKEQWIRCIAAVLDENTLEPKLDADVFYAELEAMLAELEQTAAGFSQS